MTKQLLFFLSTAFTVSRHKCILNTAIRNCENLGFEVTLIHTKSTSPREKMNQMYKLSWNLTHANKSTQWLSQIHWAQFTVQIFKVTPLKKMVTEPVKWRNWRVDRSSMSRVCGLLDKIFINSFYTFEFKFVAICLLTICFMHRKVEPVMRHQPPRPSTRQDRRPKSWSDTWPH